MSVVMPVYNEAECIGTVAADVIKNILDGHGDTELIIVDDCSTDSTQEQLEELARSDDRVHVLRNVVNLGHGPTVRRAIDASRAEWIFHLDSDGQVDPAEFDALWQHRDESDLVLGQRITRHDPAHRLFLTRITRQFVSLLAGEHIIDANVPFKLIRRELFEHLAPSIPENVFAPSILIVLGAVRSGARITTVEISHLERRHGQSTLRPVRLARAVARSTVETIRFRWSPVTPYQRV